MLVKLNKHDRIMNVLRDVATQTDHDLRTKLAAALVFKNEIISIGVNQLKSHPYQKRFSKHEHAIFLHAEIASIIKALKNYDVDTISRCTLYVMRVKYIDGHNDTIIDGLAKPCDGCLKAITNLGIKKVCYSTEEGY